MSDAPAVCIRQVTFGYDGRPVLVDVDLDIEVGETTCIVGPNGGGKTTLAKLMLGLLRPRQGRVQVFGRAPDEVRERMGYMPQHLRFDPRFPITALEVVMTGRLTRGRWGGFSAADRSEGRAALDWVGLAALEGEQFAELSGGQRQRVLLARALVGRPQLLVLDEPTANVDALAESRILDLLADLDPRPTIVMVSHDVSFVAARVERVICVNRTAAIHPTGEVSGEVIRELYGGDVRFVRHDHALRRRGHDHA